MSSASRTKYTWTPKNRRRVRFDLDAVMGTTTERLAVLLTQRACIDAEIAAAEKLIWEQIEAQGSIAGEVSADSANLESTWISVRYRDGGTMIGKIPWNHRAALDETAAS